MASEIEIETEKSKTKTQDKDTRSNHVVPVMLILNHTDRKTVKERSRSRVGINSKEHENEMSFRRHIITNLFDNTFTRGSRL